MTDLAKLQASLRDDLHLPFQTQDSEQGSTTLTVQPDDKTVLGPAGSQLVYTFQGGKFVSLEILLAAG
ncbi:hypothetical protein [Hymenobacter metallicola]|uniref:Uncharacterized protein n=1 Tax=Hymenobacter metallicola TaxID=2563114 RepID=A0A4Z0QGE0_9BACT|nr:hypothetical protein [Hymenobacter metallicola]TGE28546.1 hypothetical protein E5K02_03520 [Hymenobacter metallicola]